MDTKRIDKKRDSLGRLRHRGALLFVSVLLHSLLALFPWQEKSRPSAVSSSPTSPIPVVAARQLPKRPAADSQSLPVLPSPPASTAAVPPPPVEPTVSLTLDGSVTQASNRLLGEPAPGETPHPNIVPVATPAASPSAVPLAPASVTTTDETKIAANWENFVGQLQRQSSGFESMSLLEILNLFGEPDQASQFFDASDRPKLDVVSYHLFPDRTPEQVLEAVVMPELNDREGFDWQPLQNVTSGLAYQILQGEALRYLTIVQLNERSGSVLIVSTSLPQIGNQ